MLPMGPTNPDILPRLRATVLDPLRNFVLVLNGRKYKCYGHNVPVTSDPCWPEAVQPVLALLAQSALPTGKIMNWCHRLGDPLHHARSRIAWLSLMDLIEFKDDSKKWRPTNLGLAWLAEHPAPVVTPTPSTVQTTPPDRRPRAENLPRKPPAANREPHPTADRAPAA